MLKFAVRVIIFNCVFLTCKSIPGRMLGPGTFIYKSFENCDPPVTELDLWLTQKKYNRTTSVIDLTLSTPWPLSDDVIMEINTATKKEGGYKPGSFYMKGPFCQSLKTIAGDLFNSILAATGVDECPIPGDVKLTDFYVDSDQLNDVMYGDFRAELMFYAEQKMVGCYVMYVNLVPKED